MIIYFHITTILNLMMTNTCIHYSLDGNLRPYWIGSCKSNHKKFIIPLVASITTCVAVVLTISTIVMVIWTLRKKGKGNLNNKFYSASYLAYRRSFLYSNILSFLKICILLIFETITTVLQVPFLMNL